MAVVRKKQEDKYLIALRELVTSGGGNRQCFDCGQKGPTYVNMTIGSFVCTRCSGVLRGLTPPHRVKSISMATFTQDEIDFLKAHGNDVCAKTWLGLWDPKRVVHQDQRELMIDKYERKRYYLEPASPLKSLPNAASLKTNSSSSTAVQNNANNNNNNNANNSNSNINNHAAHNGNGVAHTNGFGGGHHKQHDNSFQNIQLTPPTSQRNASSASAASNGLHKSSSTAISRPQHHLQNGFNQQQHHHHQQQQQQQQQQDVFMLNGFATLNNGLNASSVGSASTGALSDTSSCTSNGFGPEADFVADFGTANIFDATSASSVGSPAVSSASSVASSNGYAKIQPIRLAHQQHQQQQQQQQQHQRFMNGDANSKLQMNGNGTSSATLNGNTENFADFEHAPIFNAAGLPIANGSTRTSANNNSATPAEDRYAALKDLDEQLRESKAMAEKAASIVASSVVDSFGNPANNNNANHVNPFKSQQGSLINPFQATQAPQQNLYGQMTVIPSNGMPANGYATQPQSQGAFFNYNNGFSGSAGNGGATSTVFPPTSATMGGGPSGCGFGFGTMQQQMAATAGIGGGGAYNNPFAAAGGFNTNNPFL